MPRLGPDRSSNTAIVIQAIRTTWTKASRGGTAAATRNGVPAALPLQHFPDHLDPVYLVHVAEFHEAHQFRNVLPNTASVLPASGVLRFGRLLIQSLDESVRVTYVVQHPEWTPKPPGVLTPHALGQLGTGLTPCYVEAATFRVPDNQPSFQLRSGEMGRATYNWRYSHGYWVYERWTFNLALCHPETVDSGLFLKRTPSQVLTRLSRLF